MRNKSTALGILGLVLTLAVALVMPVKAWADVVKNIAVSGSERIEEATVVSYMDLKIGDPLDDVAVDRALKSLFSTGLFADVKVWNAGSGLVKVNVRENPVINQGKPFMKLFG